MSITVKEYRELDKERLAVKIEHLEQEMRAWREQVRLGKEKNHAKLNLLKREIARAKTIMSEKESETSNQ